MDHIPSQMSRKLYFARKLQEVLNISVIAIEVGDGSKAIGRQCNISVYTEGPLWQWANYWTSI